MSVHPDPRLSIAPLPVETDHGVSVGTALPPVVALPVASDLRRVVIRLRGGEELEVGRVEGREPAVRIAHETIRLIEDAVGADEWPAVGDRFLRPDAIVSIDIQRADD